MQPRPAYEPDAPRRNWLARWFRRRTARRVAVVPAPELVVPAPELVVPAPELVVPAPELVVPAPEPVVPAPEPPGPDVTPEPSEAPVEAPDSAGAVLNAALDSLGQAHHRPFSRA
jgi:hypothetical protein